MCGQTSSILVFTTPLSHCTIISITKEVERMVPGKKGAFLASCCFQKFSFQSLSTTVSLKRSTSFTQSGEVVINKS